MVHSSVVNAALSSNWSNIRYIQFSILNSNNPRVISFLTYPHKPPLTYTLLPSLNECLSFSNSSLQLIPNPPHDAPHTSPPGVQLRHKHTCVRRCLVHVKGMGEPTWVLCFVRVEDMWL